LSHLSATHWQPPGGVWPERHDDPAFVAHKAALKAARERAQEYTSLYTRRGYAAHMSPPWSSSPSRSVLCPVLPKWPHEWLGTGSQAEYELAAELPTCSRCHAIFMDSQRCGNPECPCQQWGALPSTLVVSSHDPR
jgi:hypothetical protein